MSAGRSRPAGNRAAESSSRRDEARVTETYDLRRCSTPGIVELREIPSLRELLEQQADAHGLSLQDLTVLAVQNDPFRYDTPAGHRDGSWIAEAIEDLGFANRTVHLRGLHYAVIGRAKPNGKPYTNTDKDWIWLSAASNAARWLDYVPFEQIVDQRNAEPIIRLFEPTDPWPYLTVGIDVDIPAADDLIPRVDVADFDGVQPYKLVMYGEKSSLDPVLSPIAEQVGADLYLPTGEISSTQLNQMARIGTEDGRPMVVFTFCDADPAGWQMPISIARKLQALRAMKFPGLEVQVHRVALTPDQVRAYGLPSTPLKATEKRADRWRTEMGVQQTEIDALSSLRPDLLTEIVWAALTPFYDTTLDERVRQARSAWLTDAQTLVDAQLDTEQLDRIRVIAGEKLATLRTEIAAINDALQIATDEFLLPTPVVPDAEIDTGLHPLPLLDSRWSFVQQCRTLIDSKAYRTSEAGGVG
jgi:hypothetical protein